MSVLLGKVNNTSDYYKFLNTPDKLYEVKLDSIVKKNYSNRARLKKHEWFILENISTKTCCLNILKNYKGDAEYSQIDSSILKALNKLEYICWVEDNNNFFIQKITSGKCIVKAKAINRTFEVIDVEPFIKIEEIPDAIYIKNEDVLLFKSVSKIKSIFVGIEEISKTATKEEINSFMQNPILNLNFSFDSEKFDNKTLEQIHYAHNFFSNMDEQKKSALMQYIKDNKPEILEGDLIKIENEKDLQYALDSIQQNFYTTPITGEKRIVDTIIDPSNY